MRWQGEGWCVTDDVVDGCDGQVEDGGQGAEGGVPEEGGNNQSVPGLVSSEMMVVIVTRTEIEQQDEQGAVGVETPLMEVKRFMVAA